MESVIAQTLDFVSSITEAYRSSMELNIQLMSEDRDRLENKLKDSNFVKLGCEKQLCELKTTSINLEVQNSNLKRQIELHTRKSEAKRQLLDNVENHECSNQEFSEEEDSRRDFRIVKTINQQK